MDTIITRSIALPAAVGASFGGGFLAGALIVDDRPYALIVAPKADGHFDETKWNSKLARIDGAASFFDGLANTRAMAAAGSKIAKKVLELKIGDHNDWYVPSRDELEICYRAFKPTDDENYCWRGDNPSSLPPGYAYSPSSPGQTSIDAFRAGGAEAFERAWYWSSTQCAGSGGSAWIQNFANGSQSSAHKGGECLGRAVRRVAI